jgi:hypothetical protein
MFVRAVRKHGFRGPVELHVEGLPAGVTASCETIPPAANDGSVILTAADNAALAASNVTVTGTSRIQTSDGRPLDLAVKAVPQQETYLPGGGRGLWLVDMHTVSVGAPGDIRHIALSAYDVALRPGESKPIDVSIERAKGFDQNITLDVLFQHLGGVFGNTLPAGVTIDAAKSTTLLTGKNSQGRVTLKADRSAKPVSRRQVSLMANISFNFVMKSTYSAAPLWVSVIDPAAKK